MAEIDLSREHECSPERTRYAAETLSNLSGLVAFFVGQGRGLEGPQDLRHVLAHVRAVGMQLSVMCLGGTAWIRREINEGRVDLDGATMEAIADGGVTTALEQLNKAAEWLYQAADVAERQFTFLEKRRPALEASPRRRVIGR